jgi:hypothetical protein
MRYIELRYRNKTYTNRVEIDDILHKEGFYWLIDSELEGAIIEVNKSTIIWHSGNYYSGDWEYGIFKNGKFYGNWINGIWESGIFSGKWHSGVNLKQI